MDVLCGLGPQPDPLECQARRPRRRGHAGRGSDPADPGLLGPRSTGEPLWDTDATWADPVAMGPLVLPSARQPARRRLRPHLRDPQRTGAAADDHPRADNRDELREPLVPHASGSKLSTVEVVRTMH